MNYDFSSGANFDIPKKPNLYVIGSGISLDLFNKNNFNQKTDIIITCNGSITFPPFPPDFQLCNDTLAIPYWAKSKNNSKEVMWLARPDRISTMIELKLNHISRSNLFDNVTYTGSGAEAFNLAYYLYRYSKYVERVIYIGFDFTDLRILGVPKTSKFTELGNNPYNKTNERNRFYNNNNMKCYASENSIEVMPYQKMIQAPINWRKQKYSLSFTYNKCYQNQLKSLAILNEYDSGFAEKLVCQSFLNLRKLDLKSPTHNYAGAIKAGIKIK